MCSIDFWHLYETAEINNFLGLLVPLSSSCTPICDSTYFAHEWVGGISIRNYQELIIAQICGAHNRDRLCLHLSRGWVLQQRGSAGPQISFYQFEKIYAVTEKIFAGRSTAAVPGAGVRAARRGGARAAAHAGALARAEQARQGQYLQYLQYLHYL